MKSEAMKRILSLLMVAALLFTSLPGYLGEAQAVEAEENQLEETTEGGTETLGGSCGTNATWSLADGMLTISGSGTITDYSDKSAPWYEHVSSITKIVVEDGITKLGNNVFSRLENVTEISLPESVTNIATSAIRYCTKLESLTIPGNLTFLGARALANGGIEDLYFEGNYPTGFSGTTAFDKEVYNLHVPCGNNTWTDADLTKFGGTPTKVIEHNYVDGKCSGCGESDPDATETAPGGSCGTSATWSLVDGVLTVSGSGEMADYDSAMAVPWNDYKSDITTAEVSEGVTAVGKYAFTGCSNLASISLPSTLEKIQLRAFQDCTSLKELTIPAKVRILGQEAFKNSGITELTFEGSAPATISTGGSGVCYGMTYNLNVSCDDESWTDEAVGKLKGTATKVLVHSYVDGICSGCGESDPDATVTTPGGSCGTSATWSLADGMLTISGSGTITDYSDKSAPWYEHVDSITKIVVEDGITKLGNNAFSRLENVTEISLPESVTNIATSAIRYCTKLESLTIPGNLTFLGARALANGGIEDLYFEGNYPTGFSGTTAFDKEVYNLHVPCGNNTWTDADLTKFGGTPTKVIEHNYVDGVCDDCGDRIITSETWVHVQEIYRTYITNKGSLTYGNTKTAFNATTTNEIDCSSFVQLVLYGVPYETSRYSGNNGNVAKYDFGISLPANDGDWGAERYLANELAEYADEQGWAIDQSDIRTGDVLFFSPVDNVAYYKNITHVAICAEAPDEDGTVKVVHGTDGTSGPVCEESLSMADWKFVMAARFPLYESGVPATSLTLNKTEAALELNETLTLTVTVEPENASKRVTWTSSAETVAAVDASGRVTPVSAGKATITATAASGVSASCEVTVNAPAASSGTCGTNVNWRVEGTTLYITGSGRMTAFTAGQERGYEAWSKTITKVVVGDGVTSLDDRVFRNFTALTEIVIPATVNRIATEALYGCTALKEVSIPGNLTFLGARAFEGSGIETLIFSGNYPAGWGGSKPITTETKAYTIKYPCNNSTWATADPSDFGGNPTMVMNHALNESGVCTVCGGDASVAVTEISLDKTEATMSLAGSLTLVATLTPANAGNKLVEWTSSDPKVATVLGGKVTPVGVGETIITAIAKGGEDIKAACVVTVTDDFSGSCGSSAKYTVKDGVLTITGSGTVTQQEAWTTQKDKITSIVMESGIAELGSKAFAGLDKVTAVTLPSGLKKIQAQAFKDCAALSELTVPANVTTIGAYAFQGSGIKTLIFEKHPTGTISTEVCKGMTNYVLVLKKCSGWTDAAIEKLGGTRAETVDATRFEGAAIQGGVVKYHTGMVNTEDTYHCSQCDGTSSSGGSGGGGGGISGGVSDAVSGASSGECGESATYRIEGNTLIISGTGVTKTYTRSGLTVDYPWSGYKKDITKIVVEEGITSLGNYAFYGLTKVTEVSLPQSLTRIETRVFGRMTSLKSITIPSTLAFVGYEAFVQSGITDIYFGAGAPVNVSTTKPCTGLTYTLHTVCSDKTWTEEKFEKLGGNATLVVEHLEDYSEESGMCSRCAKFQETSASGECGENATWTLENGVLTISGTGATTKYKRISGNVIDYPWVGYVDQITKVVVKEGITSLDNYAFYAFTNLTTVELPSSLKRIETRVFGKCSSLTTLRIPSKLTFLGYEAFGESGITELWFDSDGPENLSGNAPCIDMAYTLHVICSDKSWTEAKLQKLGGTPTLVVEHRKDYSAESGTCSRCGEVKLASDSGKCGEKATWTLKDGVLTIRGTGATAEYKRVTGNVIDYPWVDYVDQITTVIVEEGITSLDNYAFYAFPNLTTVELPSSLKRIETRVFGKCSSLTTLRIPSKLTFLGYEAFGESGIVDLYFSTDAPENLSKNAPCTGMTYRLHVPCNNISWSEVKIAAMGGEATVVEEHKLVNGACIYCAAAAEGKIIGDVGENAIWTLKNGVLTITGTGALPTFSRNAEKDTINYPWADYKDQITTVVVGKGITSIGNYSFYRFTKLSSVKLPDSLEEITYGAFQGTASLTDITIPANVSKFGSQVFMESGLKTITFKGMLPTSYGKNLFDGVTATAYHRCDVDPKSMGQGLTWQAYHEYADENGVGKCSVCGAVNGALVESLALDCSELTLFVGDSATLHTTLLPEDAVFPVVAWESGEEEVAIVSEAGVVTAIAPGSTVITVKTMDGSDLTATCKVSVKKGVGGTVGDILWSFDNGVLTLSGTDATLDIAQDAAPWLQYKDEIVQLVVEDGILGIGDGAFASFDRLEQLELPASLTSIGKEAFRDTTALQQVELPASLESIGDGAFRNSGLTEIRFNGGLPTKCGTDVFDGVSAEAHIPCDTQEQDLGGEISWVKTHDYQPFGDQLKCIHCGDVQQGEGETPQGGENQPMQTEKNSGLVYALVAGAVIVAAAAVFLLRSKAKKNKMGAKK